MFVKNKLFGTEPCIIHANGGKHLDDPTWDTILASYFGQVGELKDGLDPSIAVILCNSKKEKGLTELSLDRLGIKYMVLGRGVPGWINLNKIPLTREALAALSVCPGIKYVLALDAHDVVVLPGIVNILDVWEEQGSPKMLFQAERNPYPPCTELRKHEEKITPPGTPYRYLNSGVWFGEIGYTREFFEKALRTKPIPGFLQSDQGIYRQLRLEDQFNVNIDHFCTMSQSIYLVPNGELECHSTRHDDATSIILGGHPEIPMLPITREALLELLPEGGDTVEIGVERGVFSDEILRRNKPKSLLLIDSWQESNYNFVIGKYKDNAKVTVHRGDSVESAGVFAGKQFDWVMVDANHLEDRVYNDINAWLPLVKNGGYMLCHDYTRYGLYGVIEAVDRVLSENDCLEPIGNTIDTFATIVMRKVIPGTKVEPCSIREKLNEQTNADNGCFELE